jgi:hypothetical protein
VRSGRLSRMDMLRPIQKHTLVSTLFGRGSASWVGRRVTTF